jgi:NAD(P)-dependent dehydrogenase (short-subunit alcohol dehydrogenase family)
MTKTVLITGATGKLGQVFARQLAEKDWALVLTSRDPDRCASLAENLREFGVRVDVIELDLLSAQSYESISNRLAERGIIVTHVVSNARSLDTLALGKDGLAEAEPFLNELALDVVAPYRMLMALARHPRHDLRGVVTIGSQYGQVAPNPALYEGDLSGSAVQYGVAKAALHHMTRELAVRLAPGVRINCVAFGGFAGRTNNDFQERYGRMAPLGRMLTEEDAGGRVAFLLDDAASAAMTGHVLVADGGWSIW